MIKIDNGENFKKILLNYDIFLFDMFGVVWSGNKKIEGTNETLEFLQKNNKIVYFLSNSPTSNDSLKQEFEDMGIYQNKHYNGIVTSGDVLNNSLKTKNIQFYSKKNPKNCYIFGPIDKDILNNINYNITKDIKEADFIILGFPQLSLEEYNKLDKEKYKYLVFESPMYEETYYDSLTIDVFMDKIKEIKEYNLPIINNCADLVAMQPSKNNSVLHYVIRHGTIAKKYKELGGEVIEMSKPHSMIYDLAFNRICENFNCSRDDLKNKKISMIGDTVDTDILGATNASKYLGITVDGILTLSGVSGRDFNKNISEIEKYCLKKELNLNYIVDSLGTIL